MESKNDIILVGTIVENVKIDLQYGEDVLYKTFLQISRNKDRFDRVMIVASKEQFQSCRVEIGARLYIEGEVETRNEYSLKKERSVVVYVKVRKMRKAFQEIDRNEATLIGGLCNNPKNWKARSGQNRVNFTLAVENDCKEMISFIPCVAWEKFADMASTLKTGDLIIIEGSFHSRLYNKTAERGKKEKATAYEIQISKLI